jgi:hypothetical protein
MFLTTQALVVEVPDEKKSQMPQGAGMGEF